jgi:hypothetical protein
VLLCLWLLCLLIKLNQKQFFQKINEEKLRYQKFKLKGQGLHVAKVARGKG